MTIPVSPFRSETGFLSPGFLVNPSGDISLSGNLLVSDSKLTVNGVTILEIENNTLKLSSEIVNSSLTNLEVFENFKVVGNTELIDTNNNVNISIVDGKIAINSTVEGNLDNIVIGELQPSAGTFTDLSANNATINLLTSTTTVIENLTVDASLTTNATVVSASITTAVIDTAEIAQATISNVSATEITANNININNQPTELFHATRKDYVDNRISALSIALGA
jgi:hypothetical protein